ncbi:MAG: single-stranded-DNA-specific exonuclease RecJ [Anaerolineales bacterium]
MPIRNLDLEWRFPPLVAVPGLYQAAVGGSALVSKTLYQRGFTAVHSALAFLDPSLYSPAPPSDLPDLSSAADSLQTAINNKQRILVWGDFDVDGQTSTTLLTSGLTDLGADVSFYIPVRATESHGINLPSLQARIAQYKPDLLLTCDTGIDAVEAIEHARSQNLFVIVTDHHQLPAALPNANAIINPNFLASEHPLSTLPGVGVAYKLIEELFLRQDRDPSPYLDLVALGIVADVAQQIGDTRYLLQLGLEILRSTPRPGLLELYRLAGIEPGAVTEDTIGFVIGPRLNALGRLGDANPSVEFLTTTDTHRAVALADSLDKLNQRRQDLTDEIYQESLEMIEKSPVLVEDYPVIVLAGPPTWDPGVIGIVASRLVEQFNKPVIMLSEDGKSYRGSARSVPGVHITKLIKESSDLLDSFGGHPMAAGVSMPLENAANFRSSLAEDFHRVIGILPEKFLVNIDAELSFDEITLDFVADIQRLAPFGAGNPKLLFATRSATLDTAKNIGRNGKHRKLSMTDSNGSGLDLLWWNSADQSLPEEPIDVAYSLDQSTFRDQPQVQATIQHIRHSPQFPVYLKGSPKPRFQDLRASASPITDLGQVTASRDALIWAERCIPPDHESYPRLLLNQASALVVWTSPPSRFLFSHVVEQVAPREIILFNIDPSFLSLEDFIKSLLGLLKHLRNSRKEFSISKFAQALALPEDVIEVGLEWLHQRGDFDLSVLADTVEFSLGQIATRPNFHTIDQRLKLMLQEVAAYRKHYGRSSPNSLL